MNKQNRIGIIGYGYLGRSLHESLAGTRVDVVSIYNRSEDKLTGLPESIATTDMRVFMDTVADLDLIVELAHPDISKDWGENILKTTNYMPCSVAALANEDLKFRLLKTATASATKLFVPHGAVVGIDNLYEARDNWQDVTITFRKPPGAIDMEEEPDGDETILFEGSVREIAEKFPRNVNAMVACALATVGPDVALARMIADRRLDNVLRGEFEFKGKDGSRLSIIKEEPAVGVSSPGMITSILGSVLRALQQSSEGINFV
ncbi:MAG: aspartate dehydrogenase [Gammaproteobacteria bacterium]|jgi:aspartate dehydrogenase